MRILLKLGSLIYFGLVIYITFLARRRRGHGNFRAMADLKIFDKFHPLRENWATFYRLDKSYLTDIFGNIALFVPFVPAVILLFGRHLKIVTALLITMGTSLSIEMMQYITNRGVFDLDDVVLNTIGGMLGFILCRLSLKLWRQKKISL